MQHRLSLVAIVHLGAVKSRKNKSMNTVNFGNYREGFIFAKLRENEILTKSLCNLLV